MTVLSGEKMIVDSFEVFTTAVDVDEREIFEALPEDKREGFLEEVNTIAEDEERETYNGEGEMPEWVTVDFMEWLHILDVDTHQLIIRILENRDREYVHLYDGFNHTVVRVFADDELP